MPDIIKYEGDNSTFIWKHPCEDFYTNTQLIVHESQEALFFMNGQALDLFGPGRHTLETQNIPKIGGFFKKLFDKDTPFHCEVYFINKTVQMSIKWGTDSKVHFIEPTMGIPLEIGACGELNLSVMDARKLLLKLVGTTNGIAWGDSGAGFTKSIQNCFRPLISTAVKKHLPVAIRERGIDLFAIDEHLADLSEILRKSITPGFEEYGLTIPELYITNVALPENDPNFRRMRELHTLTFQTRVMAADEMIKTAQIESDARVRTAHIEADASVKLAGTNADASVRVASAQADASVAVAQRQAELERQRTETEIARSEAERELIRAQAEAQAARMAGMVEAEVMGAKGYTQRDVMAHEVQMAYAESIGDVGAAGGLTGDLVGLGVGIAAMNGIGAKVGEALGVTTTDNSCKNCGATLPEGAKFCLECGERVAASVQTVVCPACQKTVAKGKFCPECGYKFITHCPKCNKAVMPGAKFCLECGERL